MHVKSEPDPSGRCLRLSLEGSWNLEEVFAVIDRIRWETELAGIDRAFADMRSVEGPIPALDRFFAGERVASVLGSRVRLAVLSRPELIDKLGENAAVNRGARILVTASEPEALEFLA
ncbi:MAG TPA: hypothetical protein VFL12_01675 [Thermoanaerobaculia bacterium]|nr:hypothetical protein [Thermoanaerobaculia bacterium]